jgi:hypothetical protein
MMVQQTSHKEQVPSKQEANKLQEARSQQAVATPCHPTILHSINFEQ